MYELLKARAYREIMIQASKRLKYVGATRRIVTCHSLYYQMMHPSNRHVIMNFKKSDKEQPGEWSVGVFYCPNIPHRMIHEEE